MAKVRAFIDFLVERFSGQSWSQLADKPERIVAAPSASAAD
jgi:hypothetical protein